MEYRGLLLIVACASASTLGLTLSCNAPDPGEITFVERPRGTEPVSTSSSSGDPDGGGSSSGADGGGSSGGAVTAFTGAPAYATPAAGASSANGNHADGNPGINCMDCHRAGGTAAGNPWGIAGTIYAAPTGAAIVAQAEIRLVDATGKQLASVYTDPVGNFWSDPIAGGIPAGAKVGVRNGTLQKLMATALSGDADGACQRAGCHATGAGAQGHMYLN